MNNFETNKIICGDCIEEMKKMPDQCIDLIFADPPYWLRVDGVLHRVNGNKYNGCNEDWDQFNSIDEYKSFTKAWLSECKRILKRNGSIWVIGGMQCIYSIGAIMQDLGFWFINDVIWFKSNPTPNFMGTRLNNSHETLLWAIKNQKNSYTFNYKTAKELNTDTVSEKEFARKIRKQMGSVWKLPVCQGAERIKDNNGNKLHSTQKPEALLYRIIAINSKLNDIVFDPFGGTMTTAVIAKRMGRRYLSIEKDPIYCKFGQDRINKTTPHIGKIERADFDKKPPRVTFEEMIQHGYFIDGEKMYYQGKPYFYLNKSGKLFRNDTAEIIDIHSAIAKIKGVKAERLNGWDYWQVNREGHLISIDNIRKKYLKEITGYEQN